MSRFRFRPPAGWARGGPVTPEDILGDKREAFEAYRRGEGWHPPAPEFKRQPFVAGLGQAHVEEALRHPDVRHASFVYDGREVTAIHPRAWAERGVLVITRLGVDR